MDGWAPLVHFGDLKREKGWAERRAPQGAPDATSTGSLEGILTRASGEVTSGSAGAGASGMAGWSPRVNTGEDGSLRNGAWSKSQSVRLQGRRPGATLLEQQREHFWEVEALRLDDVLVASAAGMRVVH